MTKSPEHLFTQLCSRSKATIEHNNYVESTSLNLLRYFICEIYKMHDTKPLDC